jgi:hypothetical protein
MLKPLLASSSFFLLLAACNNAGVKKQEGEAKTKDSAGHEMHHMPVDNSSVPAVPAVPDGARVFFKNLKDGQEISLPFTIVMGADHIKVDTANGPVTAGSGHHHLLINSGDSVMAGNVIAKDSLHIHFGKGQTEYELKGFPPGKYKLALQMGDALHRSYGGKLSAAISVEVKK